MAAGALLTALLCAPLPAEGGSPFDGYWRVMIRSAAEHCKAAGYGLRIRNGLVSYLGLAPIRVQGRVDHRGRVNVRLHGGDRWAEAAGHLKKNSGAGTWRGRSQHRLCTGRWWARRN
jgi:hypothetical protein